MESLTFIFVFYIAAFFFMAYNANKNYVRCPPNKILVVYGKLVEGASGKESGAKCYHGKNVFVYPIVQDYEFLDINPLQIEVHLPNALSKDDISINIISKFSAAISTDPQMMNNAAERLLGLQSQHIKELASDIIVGQVRILIAMLPSSELRMNNENLIPTLELNINRELSKIGLQLMNTTINNIIK
ncbi:MAG: SPFH domain-containing protein [Chitinophagales bacterium]